MYEKEQKYSWFITLLLG